MIDYEHSCKEFGSRLRQFRHDRGLSQEQLGHLTGLDRTYISQCESGKRNVTLKTILSFASALEIDPADLVNDIGPDAEQ